MKSVIFIADSYETLEGMSLLTNVIFPVVSVGVLLRKNKQNE